MSRRTVYVDDDTAVRILRMRRGGFDWKRIARHTGLSVYLCRKSYVSSITVKRQGVNNAEEGSQGQGA
jgi:hypothetical protein